MSRQDPVLKKIVGLKRQQAEQRVLGLQQELARLHGAVRSIEDALATADSGTVEVNASLTARVHGHVDKLVGDLNAMAAARGETEAQLALAKEALAEVIYSEERLSAMGKG